MASSEKVEATTINCIEREGLADLEREFSYMGASPYFVQKYVKNLPYYPDVASMENLPIGHIMMPPGTIAVGQYMDTLSKLTADMESAERELDEFWKTPKTAADYVTSNNNNAKEERDARAKTERNLLVKSHEILGNLYKHVEDYRPIDVRAFHEKMRQLIKKRAQLQSNIRIREASDIFLVAGRPSA